MHIIDNRKRTVRLNGIDMNKEDVVVHYTEIGPEYSSRVAVFLHGLGTSRNDFVPHMKWLSDKYPSWRMLAIDFPGFGDAAGNALQKNANGITAYTHLLHAFLDSLNVRRVCVFGWSLGATVALLFALSYPKRVVAIAEQGAQENGGKLLGLRITQIGGAYVRNGDAVRGLNILKTYIATKRRTYQKFSTSSFVNVFSHALSACEVCLFASNIPAMKSMFSAYAKCDIDAHAQAFFSTFACDMAVELASCNSSVLVMDGKHFDSGKMPLYSAERIMALLPEQTKSELFLVPYAGHFATILFPEIVLREAMRFFSYHADIQTWRGWVAHRLLK